MFILSYSSINSVSLWDGTKGHFYLIFFCFAVWNFSRGWSTWSPCVMCTETLQPEISLWLVSRWWKSLILGWPRLFLLTRNTTESHSLERAPFSGSLPNVWVKYSLIQSVKAHTCNFLKLVVWKPHFINNTLGCFLMFPVFALSQAKMLLAVSLIFNR